MLQANTTQVVPFTYRGGVRLREACWLEGRPWFTRRAIGEWLGYKHPEQAVTRLVERHPYIEDGPCSTIVRLTTVEGNRQVNREVRVYDPIGLQLITFKASTERAVKYQVAVAHLVWAYLRGELKPKRSRPDPEWTRTVLQLAEVSEMYDPHERRQAVNYMAAKLDRSRSTIYRKLRLVQCGYDPMKPYEGGRPGFRFSLRQQAALDEALSNDRSLSARGLQKMLTGERVPSIQTIKRFKRAFLAWRVAARIESIHPAQESS